MITFITASFLVLCSSLFIQAKAAPPTDFIRVYGSCYNANTGADVKVRAFAKTKKGKVKLGDSNKRGRFDVQVPSTTTFLSFESVGFQTVTIPVNFIGKIDESYKFNMLVPMSAKDSARIKLSNQVYMSFADVDSLDVSYEVRQGKSLALITSFTAKEFKRKGIANFLLRDIPPGDYQLTGSTADGRVLFSEMMKVEAGTNFKALPVSGSQDIKVPDAIQASTKAKAVYFDQRQYELSAAATITLDSIATILTAQRDLVVRISGYTDTIGLPALNTLLADYRANTVADYLKTRWVAANQLRILVPEPVPVYSAEKANKRRRVELQIISRN